MSDVVCVSSSPSETREIAGALASSLRAGDVVVLSGDLGAGKTCFVQGAAAALGVSAHVTSPSFVLVCEYAGRVRVVHVDVYRLSSLQEMIDLGYEELFPADGVTFIEWGDAVAGLLPDERVEVELRVLDEDRRQITIGALGSEWPSRIAGLGLDRWTVLA